MSNTDVPSISNELQNKKIDTNKDIVNLSKKKEEINRKKSIDIKQVSENTNNNLKNISAKIESGKVTKDEAEKLKEDIISNKSNKANNDSNNIFDSGFEDGEKNHVEEILGKNAFTTMLKQITQLFAILFNNLSGGFSGSNNFNKNSYIENNNIEKGGKNIAYKEEEIEVTKNEDIDKIYDKYDNYKKYRKHIQIESKNAGISELEVIKLLVKENSIADSSVYGPGKDTSIYGIGQMSKDTWDLVEKTQFKGVKMNRLDPKTQISMAIGYMKYIKSERNCSDSEAKFFYNAGHNFELDNSLVSRDYISGNLKPIVYKDPKYNGKSVDEIYGVMTKSEYFAAAKKYYNSNVV